MIIQKATMIHTAVVIPVYPDPDGNSGIVPPWLIPALPVKPADPAPDEPVILSAA